MLFNGVVNFAKVSKMFKYWRCELRSAVFLLVVLQCYPRKEKRAHFRKQLSDNFYCWMRQLAYDKGRCVVATVILSFVSSLATVSRQYFWWLTWLPQGFHIFSVLCSYMLRARRGQMPIKRITFNNSFRCVDSLAIDVPLHFFPRNRCLYHMSVTRTLICLLNSARPVGIRSPFFSVALTNQSYCK